MNGGKILLNITIDGRRKITSGQIGRMNLPDEEAVFTFPVDAHDSTSLVNKDL